MLGVLKVYNHSLRLRLLVDGCSARTPIVRRKFSDHRPFTVADLTVAGTSQNGQSHGLSEVAYLKKVTNQTQTLLTVSSANNGPARGRQPSSAIAGDDVALLNFYTSIHTD